MATFYQVEIVNTFTFDCWKASKAVESNGMEKELILMYVSVFISYLCDVKNANMISKRASERASW